MEGASALQGLLDEFPAEPLAVFAVWEPVLLTDVARPTSATLGLLHDVRVRQYWDRDRALSAEIVRTVRTEPDRYGIGRALPEDFIVWDVVAVFAAGARWTEEFPVPAYYGGPVVRALGDTRAALGRELAATPR